MPTSNPSDYPFTLDPPGSIAVIGAGPLGIEAALYGRFLGYNITTYEAGEVGKNIAQSENSALPFLPDRSISNLACQALKTQLEVTSLTFPTTLNDWIDHYLKPLTETDLLAGRVFTECTVTQIELEPVESDEDPSEDDLPEDFKVTYQTSNGVTEKELFEAVVIATGKDLSIEIPMPIATPYLFRVGCEQTENWEMDLANGLQEIVKIYASLGGRDNLDLYRPTRS
ncbi:MAG: hypothetical protein ACPHL6_06705 [Rubripirellula sp.]